MTVVMEIFYGIKTITVVIEFFIDAKKNNRFYRNF